MKKKRMFQLRFLGLLSNTHKGRARARSRTPRPGLSHGGGGGDTGT